MKSSLAHQPDVRQFLLQFRRIVNWACNDDTTDVPVSSLSRVFFVFRHYYIHKLLLYRYGNIVNDCNVQKVCATYMKMLRDKFNERTLRPANVAV